MITFFTTTKTFSGINRANQINAIKSWTIGNSYDCEVIIFGRSKGIEEIKDIPSIRIIDNVQSNETGVPFINGMFLSASQLANHQIVCFLNADILINDSFIANLLRIDELAKRDYLVVGQRIDIDLHAEIDFTNKNWFADVLTLTQSNSRVHPPLGSDFFCFPKGQYPDGSLPDLLVGRPGWDLYMIYNARVRRLKLIDLSPSYMVLHQNHDYTHKNENKSVKDLEDNYNYRFLPNNEKYKYLLNYCNYLFHNQTIIKSYRKSNHRRFYAQEVNLYKLSIIQRVFLKIEIFLVRLFSRATSM